MAPGSLRIALPGSSRVPLAGSRQKGPVNPNEGADVTILLRRREDRPIREPSFYTSPILDRTPMGRPELVSRFGMEPADVGRVVSFVSNAGLTLNEVSLARRIIAVSGSLAVLGEAFGVNLTEYEHSSGQFRGRTGPIYIPADLQEVIQGVFGLDSRPQALPHFRRLDKQKPVTRAYKPRELQAIYNFPLYADGGRQCLALIVLGGKSTCDDLSKYWVEPTIPMPLITAVDLRTQNDLVENSLNEEVLTSLHVAGSLAPGAKFVVYFADNTEAGLLDAVTTAIYDDKNYPSVLCIPWGAAESLWTHQAVRAIHEAFEAAAALGITVCVAAGDDGSADGIADGLAHVDFPASSPFALACGGTHLETSGSSFITESVWNQLASGEGATGGGISDSQLFPLPAWQVSLNVPPSVNDGHIGRGIPDVAANADPYTGYASQANGEFRVMGGTGAAAALWSALIARINQLFGLRVGYINPYLARYAGNPKGFRNIIAGNNGAYQAGPGWNACTGHGTPRGSELARLLESPIVLSAAGGNGGSFDSLISVISDRVPQLASEVVHVRPEVQPRYTNVCITKSKRRLVLPPKRNLRSGGNYALRLNIGPWIRESVVRNAKPFRADLLPPTKEGHWLEVVIASNDFHLKQRFHHVFLPRLGASYVCSCRPGSEHHCRENDRLPYLFVPIRVPTLRHLLEKESGHTARQRLRKLRSLRAQLRIAIYHRKNLIESQLLTAAVRPVEGPGAGYRSLIDYSLTSHLSDVDFLPQRTLNILTNDNADGSHKLVINSDTKNPISFSLNSEIMGVAIAAARQTLKDIGVKEYGGKFGAKVQYESLYDKNNCKSKDDFIADLRKLASLGWKLWTTLFQNRPGARTALSKILNRSTARPAMIQVSRTEGSTLMFPWSLVYDIPLESDTAKHKLCPSLASWDTRGRPVSGACPFEQTHRKNVICPFGFWGINHVIEQPPSMPEARDLPLVIKKAKAHDKPQLVMGISLNLDESVTSAHKVKLTKNLPGIEILPKNSRDEIETALAQEELELVYFYCHGRRELLAGTTELTPYIEVGKKEAIAPDDITAWQTGDNWSETHWKETSPLVFINGCHTAELTPELLINFVDSFVGVYAAGVIGTEILLLQEVASEAAEQVLAAMNEKDQSGQHFGVGQAMRKMRLYFLGKGNLLGLAYTPYCSADLKLAV